MNDTMDHATVWRGTLYEGHYVANVDQATVWPDAFYEGHYVADMDRTTVWPRRTLRATACGRRGSGNTLAEMHSTKDTMWLT